MSENIKYPTLHVKNFAKIKEAKIELSPFTLFIGDNNSGKSYLMTLVYGLIRYTATIINIIFKNEKDIEKLEEYKKAKYIIESYINNLDFNKEAELSSEEVEIFIELFNVLLNKYSNEVINYIFNSDNEIKLENIKLEFYNSEITFRIKKENRSGSNKEMNTFDINKIISGKIISGMWISFDNDNIYYNEIIKTIIGFIISNYLDTVFLSLYINREIFLPVSRTGFLLSRNDISSSARAAKFDRYAEKNNEYLSRPIMDFLDNFDKLSKQKNDIEYRTKTLIDFIEKNMLFGKIMINEETKNIYYKPDNTELEFQMYLSSAVVTELTPLYLFLKYGFIKRKLLMEEPEISLHPKLQQQLTRLFIKLINTGVNVMITTHSDTIIQHINNMIKLNNNKEDIKKELMKKYNYNEDDLISEDKVRMYQFDIKEDGFTEITEIKGSKYGFQAPTFHNYLMQSSEEFEAFIEDLDN
ncbi:AAA family ATPase [Brachyspira hyodysenteriae]|uniref:AAA family ATPase n=1 Tax=Brachyspira hyodysenteriae TaxID=159 RepID=UPI00069A2A57|nr:AAA family ATPase [Brachyspira hyodysenteriae]MCZ9919806.1 ATP-binding protein [Brachyspira hyodysenteriae]MCZ9961901.1 ATP-binding protein [Brachyspira hyodysenteriae]MCZ9964523.1 ATP-binding protein [Brachyspira hyodysenteriae]MDA0157680.1 ATP-binding protein [Brachyspira hyodysenteriae]